MEHTNDNKIDGLRYAQHIHEIIKQYVRILQTQYHFIPQFTIIMVGNHPASEIYVKNKLKLAERLNINAQLLRFNENITENQLIDKILNINHNNDTHGIILQLPLPLHIDQQKALSCISPTKDLDGLTPLNIGLLHASKDVPYSISEVLQFMQNTINNQSSVVSLNAKDFVNKINNLGITTPFIPCTPLGCHYLIEATFNTNKEKIVGKNAVVIGNSNLVSKPMARLLLQSGATVTTLHSKSRNIQHIIDNADIIVSATGHSQALTNIKRNAILIDVGIRTNTQSNGVVGDLDYQLLSKTNKITPVPKGVGPMTVATLMLNSVLAGLKAFHSRQK